jgi:ribulose-5-phosphate 4-epimerase/fuculose-1-phosphate aldolase
MTVLTENKAREEICRIGKSLFDRGYVHATAGNISVRLDESEGGGFLITPTDACLGFLDPARLARLDADGRQLGGDTASKTIALHRGIYAAAAPFDPATRCVIHTHSTHCVALSLHKTTEEAQELLPPLTPYFVMKVGHVPLMAYHRPGDPAAAGQVGQALTRYGQQGTPIRAVMLARLGPNVWHDSPAAAMAVLEELEETARLASLCGATLEPLGDAHIEQLRQVFGARW